MKLPLHEFSFVKATAPLFKRHVLPLLKYPVYIQLYAGSVNFGMVHV